MNGLLKQVSMSGDSALPSNTPRHTQLKDGERRLEDGTIPGIDISNQDAARRFRADGIIPRFVARTADKYFHKALDNGTQVGPRETEQEITDISCAAIAIACRLHDIPIHSTELAAAFDTERTVMLQQYQNLSRRIGASVRPITIRAYIKRVGATLDLPPKTTKQALDLYDTIEDTQVEQGCDHFKFAIAIQYAASMLVDEPITQTPLNNSFPISQVTMRRTYRRILANVAQEYGSSAEAVQDAESSYELHKLIHGDNAVYRPTDQVPSTQHGRYPTSVLRNASTGQAFAIDEAALNIPDPGTITEQPNHKRPLVYEEYEPSRCLRGTLLTPSSF